MKIIKIKRNRGFTLIEILVVIGIIAVLASIVIVAINPGRQFAQARNTQRTSNIETILNAIGQNTADNKGVFTCAAAGAVIDTSVRVIKYAAAATIGASDLYTCIVPTYTSAIPFDPGNTTVLGTANPHFTSETDYDTEYTVTRDATTQRITICAPGSVEPALSNPPAICLTR